MPKRFKDSGRGQNRHASYAQSPQWQSRGTSPSARLRGLLHDVIGSSYDRDPCPAVERTRELVPHPMHPDRPNRTVVQVTDAPCIRPGSHRHSKDPAEALHADDTGSTWE